MTATDADAIRGTVRERYAAVALAVTPSCCPPSTCCDDGATVFGAGNYGDAELGSLPDGAVAASLGCGNPTALADLRPGEVVLDLGAGGGIDVLLSARRVGPTGMAYGIDMTPEMLDLARRNQAEAGIENAEFRLGSIEAVPLPDASVDVIISNCVVNLSPDKDRVFAEAFRVLRPGGRLAIADVVLGRALPVAWQGAVELWTGCVAGALVQADYEERLARAGFVAVAIEVTNAVGRDQIGEIVDHVSPGVLPDGTSREAIQDDLDGVIRSAFVRASKPS